MRQFYEAYRTNRKVSALLRQLPWTHHLLILGQAKPVEAREFYILAAMQCLVAFELKTESFKPADLGQLSFYAEALDRDVKKPRERPSIGVLLCATKDDEVVEAAIEKHAQLVRYYVCVPLDLADARIVGKQTGRKWESAKYAFGRTQTFTARDTGEGA